MTTENPLVSIIIPTFNRAHLIGETLDSVLAQTYQNWECIVVDDGSTDNTDALMAEYIAKDSRFQYFHRPQDRLAGGNAARNYGFEQSRGEYIQWFDSDDLMMKDNLMLKMRIFEDEFDFVIGCSINFNANGVKKRTFPINDSVPINAENFIIGKICWITNDILIRKNVICIRFNEKLKAGQEYNFFSRLLYFTTKGLYLKKPVAMRRIHVNSIQENLKTNDLAFRLHQFNNELVLLEDIYDLASTDIIKRSIKRLIRFSFYITSPFCLNQNQKRVLYIVWSNGYYSSAIVYFTWICFNLLFGKGYMIVKYSIKCL